MLTEGQWIHYFFFNDTATPEIYTLSLHDALPIFPHYGFLLNNELTDFDPAPPSLGAPDPNLPAGGRAGRGRRGDRESTRLNSSPSQTSYAAFCLKKKKAAHSETVSAHSGRPQQPR